MAEYIDKNKLDMAFVDRCAGDCGCCSYWETESYGYDCNLIHNFPPADVVEREKIDKAIEEIEQLINHSKLPATDSVVCNKEDWCGASEPCKYCGSNSDSIGREEDWWNAPYRKVEG